MAYKSHIDHVTWLISAAGTYNPRTQPKIIGLDSIPTAVRYRIEDKESSNRARKALTASNRHWGYMSIRAVRQTPYKKYNGTSPTERTDTVIPYRIAHVYVLESGLDFWPCNVAYKCSGHL